MGNIMSSSFAPECTPLKQEYDDCFNHWYSEEFLKGQGQNERNPCIIQWDKYSKCITKHLEENVNSKGSANTKDLKMALDDARREAPFETGGEIKQDINNK